MATSVSYVNSVVVTQNKPIPNLTDLILLSDGAIANARQRHDDAQVLVDASRWAAAHSFATLGMEEMGKAFVCGIAIVAPVVVTDGLPFWRMLRSHEGKLFVAHTLLALIEAERPAPSDDEFVEGVVSAATLDNAAKFNSLYVDYRDGKVVLPSTVDEAGARLMVAQLGKLLDEAGVAFSAGNLRDLVTAEGDDLVALTNIMRRLMSCIAQEVGSSKACTQKSTRCGPTLSTGSRRFRLIFTSRCNWRAGRRRGSMFDRDLTNHRQLCRHSLGSLVRVARRRAGVRVLVPAYPTKDLNPQTSDYRQRGR